ncbi:hypothetical protein [Polyangium spumosum]|uniref:Uncharacterized protein n=1 Tax=Polyangium spumosum TaxID=889282 RepID=A0A6N7PKS8_9BACT|nr:hypothetical protein [Polyangium spumosum]MRG90715.1 hypothetical protein [Polyangium spumosum]
MFIRLNRREASPKNALAGNPPARSSHGTGRGVWAGVLGAAGGCGRRLPLLPLLLLLLLPLSFLTILVEQATMSA